MRMNPYQIPDNLSNRHSDSNKTPDLTHGHSIEFEEENLSYAQKVQLILKDKEKGEEIKTPGSKHKIQDEYQNIQIAMDKESDVEKKMDLYNRYMDRKIQENSQLLVPKKPGREKKSQLQRMHDELDKELLEDQSQISGVGSAASHAASKRGMFKNNKSKSGTISIQKS